MSLDAEFYVEQKANTMIITVSTSSLFCSGWGELSIPNFKKGGSVKK